MRVLSRKYARDLYLPELGELIEYGDVCDVRGRQTREILNFVSEIEEPQHHCILIPSRHWNPWLAMSEFLWIMAGRNDIAALQPYNSHIGDYSDDGVHLYGAYGPRITPQIDDVITRLQKDPSDRRAVIQIWDNNNGFRGNPSEGIWEASGHRDLTIVTKDPPCNDMLFFKLRDNKLHMTVINRSNDIHFGLFAVNITTFGMLLEYMAARLGVELGTQTHLSNSLHVYTDDPRAVAITDRMYYKEDVDMPRYPNHQNAFYPKEGVAFLSWDTARDMCNHVLEGEPLPNKRGFLFFNYAAIFLGCYRRRDISVLDDFPEFADWNLAAKLWAKAMWK